MAIISLLLVIGVRQFTIWQSSQSISANEIEVLVHSSKWEGQVYVNSTEINVPNGVAKHVQGYIDAFVVDLTIVNKLDRNVELACSVIDLDTKQGFSSRTDATSVKHSESFSFTSINAQSKKRGKLTYSVPKNRKNLLLDCGDGITHLLAP